MRQATMDRIEEAREDGFAAGKRIGEAKGHSDGWYAAMRKVEADSALKAAADQVVADEAAVEEELPYIDILLPLAGGTMSSGEPLPAEVREGIKDYLLTQLLLSVEVDGITVQVPQDQDVFDSVMSENALKFQLQADEDRVMVSVDLMYRD